MKTRFIIRAKNENFRAARIAAGYPTLISLARVLNVEHPMCLTTNLCNWENFKGYPSRKSRYVPSMERILSVPYDYLFDEEYRQVVDRGFGNKIEIVKEVNLLDYGRELLLPSAEEEYEDNASWEGLWGGVMAVLEKHFTAREQEVVKKRFGIGLDRTYTLKEIGDGLGVQKETVRQIEARVMRRIMKFGAWKLRNIYERSW